MTSPPDYVVHQVNEKDVTVDWLFTRGWGRRRIRQLALMVVGWAFAVLPAVITAMALLHLGWWNYREGFRMWEVTTMTLTFLVVVFIVGFLALHIIHRVISRASAGRREDTQGKTYDAERLSRRLELAADLYDSKYGSKAFRMDQKRIVIEPFQDFETYELRDRYREYGVN